MAITNATRLSDFAAGIGTEGAILKIDNANQRIGIGTQLPSQMLEVGGIVSATQYIGDGSLLEGIKSAGLGTAIGESNTVEEVIYYTNDLLTVAETTTVNPPASASAAYTQYRDVKLDTNVDLIIETGDDFIPDILGFGDDTSDPNAAGNGVFDEVYTGIIKNKDGLGAPAFANGLTSVGVITATGGFSGTASNATAANAGFNVTGGPLDVGDGNITNVGEISLDVIKPDNGSSILIRSDTDKNLSVRGNIGEIGDVTGFQATNDAESALTDFGIRATTIRFATSGGERLRIGAAGQLGIAGANYGTSGQVLTSQGSGSAVQWADAAGGISEYDVWAVDADASGSSWDYAVIGSGSPFAVSIARCTTSQNPLFTKIGTGMSYSSGVWSFPSNGLWEINFTILHYNSGTFSTALINVTTDNGSTWGPGNLTNQYQGIGQNYVNTSQYGELSLCSTVTISDTTNQKIRFVLKNSGSESIYGSANALLTYWTFKKLA